MTAAQEMVNLGLKDRGYEYVNSEDLHTANQPSCSFLRS